ncbi:MAG TPA: hypothetical protein V6C72_13635 [Chroococcales cyanobacterium]
MGVTGYFVKAVEEGAARISESPAATRLLAEAGVWEMRGASPSVAKLLEARQPLTNFADELSYGIRRNYWENVIGDDVSGRVPARITWEMMRLHSKETGTKLPNLFFAAVGHETNNVDALSKWMDGNKVLKNGRTLLVTEYIEQGRTIAKFSSAFQRNGIPFDVATVSARDAPVFVGPSLPIPRSSSLLLSHESVSHRMWLYSKNAPEYRAAIGVERVPDSITAVPNGADPKAIAELRQRMDQIASYLYQTKVKR